MKKDKEEHSGAPEAPLIVGKHGFIAGRLAQRAAARGVDVKFTSSRPTGSDWPLDLTHPEAFDYARLDANSGVVVLAAWSSPDRCRADPARCRAVNVEGTGAFIEAALARGARVLFASSDTVYGERPQPCDEATAPHPVGEYAGMKREVEARFAHAPGFKALRLSYVFARNDRFTAYLARCAEHGQEAEVFAPLDRRIVHIDDVADAILGAFDQWSYLKAPWINVGGPRLYTRIEVAEAYRRLCAPHLRYRVRDPGPAFYDARPRMIDMESPHLARLLGRRPRTLEEAMAVELDLCNDTGHAAHGG